MGREELARLTDEFLARGGKITKCHIGEQTLPQQDFLNIREFSEYLGEEPDIDDLADRHISKEYPPSVPIGAGCRWYRPIFNHD